MPHQFRPQSLEERNEAIAIEEIEFVEGEARLLQRTRNVLALAEKEVVDAVNLVAFRKKTFEEVGSDEARGAGDDDSHVVSRLVD